MESIMKNVKKLEILIEKRDLETVVEILDEFNAPFYYIIKDIVGKDFNGIKHGDDLNDVFKNCLVTSILPDETIEKIKIKMNEVFKKKVGICIVYNNVESVTEIF